MNQGPVTAWGLEDWKEYLLTIDFLASEELLSISKAGEGNMNLALRLIFKNQSIIAKHSPPYCFKFPHIPAPVERLKRELEFYQLASASKVNHHFMPKILHFNETCNIVFMEDLGVCQDFGHLYEGWESENLSAMISLSSFLESLHSLNVEETQFENTSMRALNHNYIFGLPFSDKGHDLTPYFLDKTPEAKLIRNDPRLIDKVSLLGTLYLNEGHCLVHGDFYPRSWLQTTRGPVVIDPEFGFKGLPEFDFGVFIAHLKMSLIPAPELKSIMENYRPSVKLDFALINAFAGVEILRRLLYVTQLPLKIDTTQRLHLLEDARTMVLE
ncbi:MAG: phosphotransferase [Bacteriovoracaceae bacterium]|nr:phosphotransferase [Bacteriovoracaceae bacterium]